MKRFGEWVLEQYKLMERKKAHYSKDVHDTENYPQVGREYETIRNLSRPTLQKIAAKRGIDPHEPNGKLTSDILTKEFGQDKIAGFYDKKKDTAYKVQARKKAKKAGKPSYQKDDKYNEQRD
jgi:hypothetical protein